MFHSFCKEDTIEYAKKFAKTLNSGDVVFLYGQLGAGKTAFCEGVVIGLENNSYVSSPTFGIMNMYIDGKIKVYHFDLYRLKTMQDVYDSGLDEYLCNKDAICIVEWPNVIEDFIKNAKKVYIEYTDDGRIIRTDEDTCH